MVHITKLSCVQVILHHDVGNALGCVDQKILQVGCDRILSAHAFYGAANSLGCFLALETKHIQLKSTSCVLIINISESLINSLQYFNATQGVLSRIPSITLFVKLCEGLSLQLEFYGAVIAAEDLVMDQGVFQVFFEFFRHQEVVDSPPDVPL